jgi:predicted nucleotidyltransferase
MILNEKIEELVTKFPLLLSVAQKLNDARVDWMIGGSGCLFLLGNKRVPGDVDIVLPDNQHDIADELFGITSYTHASQVDRVRNSNPGGDHSIQITSHLEFNLDKRYEFRVTGVVSQKKIRLKYEDVDLYLLPPEDVLLIKALLQRGLEEGKKDVEDITNFMGIYRVDQDYLSRRIAELGAEQRVGGVFRSQPGFHIIT